MLKPLLNNVLLIKYNNSNNQLIYMPNSNTEYQVISVGEQVKTVKENDIVIVKEENLKKVEHNNITYYVVSIEDILLVVEG